MVRQLRRLCCNSALFLVLISVCCSITSAQQKLVLGQTVNGALEKGDYQYPNTGYTQNYQDHYLYNGRKGEKIKVKVESDISVVAELGMLVNETDKEWSKLPYRYRSKSAPETECKDCGQGKIFTIPEDGAWLISVYALGNPPGYGSTGKYSLTVEQIEFPKVSQSPLREILPGESRIFKITKNQDLYEEWSVAGKKDERMRITVSSKVLRSGKVFEVGTGRGVLFSELPTEDVHSDRSSPTRDPVEIKDALLPADGNYTIRLAYFVEEPGDYKIGIESLGFPSSAADIPISSGGWVKVGENNDYIAFADLRNTVVSGPNLLLARTRFDDKKPKKDEIDQSVIFIEFNCDISYATHIKPRSAAGYSNGKVVATIWLHGYFKDSPQGTFGTAIKAIVCKDKGF